MNVCPKCGKRFPDVVVCPDDEAPLAPARVVDAFLGRMLGNFRVEKLLAAGGMGSVFIARHAKLGTPAVVKVLSSDLARDDAERRRFENEARHAMQIQHPHVVRIFDFGELATADGAGRDVYLVMELVEGEDAEQALEREGRLDPLRVARIVRQVASALEAAHTIAGGAVVHRDLKPSNIRLTRRGREEHAVVLDFGIAKAVDAPAEEQLTLPGTVIGTPHYMAPEQASGEPIDARTDLYSLGVVAYYLLTGNLPFDGKSVSQVIRQQIFMAPPPLPADLKLPQGLGEIVMKCLEKAPAARFQSAAELADALDRVIAEATPRRPAHRAAVALAAAVGLVAVGAAVFAIVKQPPPGAARVAALTANGRDLLAAERAYFKEDRVAIEGEIAGLAEGEVILRARERDASSATPAKFRFELGPLEEGPVPIALLARPRGGDETQILARVLVRDTRPPRLAPRALPSDAYKVDLAAKTLYVRKERIFLPFEIADENPLPENALTARAAGGLVATPRAGQDGVGLDLDCGKMPMGPAVELACRAVDAAGNEASATYSVIYDPSPPFVSIVECAPDQGNRLVLKVEASDSSGIAELFLDGTSPVGPIPPRPPIDWKGSGVARFELALDAEGEYALRVVAVDRAGNRSEARRSYRHGIAFAPVFRFSVEPAADGVRYTSAENLHVELDGNKPIVEAEASLEASLPDGPAPATGNGLQLSFRLYRNTAQTLKIRGRTATDAFEREFAIVQDDAPPKLALASPSGWPETIGLALAPAGALPVEVSLEDANPPESILVNGAAVPLVAGRAKANVPLVDGKELTLTITARDRAGNESTLTRTARVDLKPPVIVAAPTQPRFKLHETAAIRIETDEDCREVTVDGSTANVRAAGPRAWVFETPMFLDTPLRRTIAAVDLAGNRADREVALEREAVCATTGIPLPDDLVKVLLEDPRANTCTQCGKDAISPEGQKRKQK